MQEKKSLEREEKKIEEEISRVAEAAPKTLIPPRGVKLDWLKIAAMVVSSRKRGCDVSALYTYI